MSVNLLEHLGETFFDSSMGILNSFYRWIGVVYAPHMDKKNIELKKNVCDYQEKLNFFSQKISVEELIFDFLRLNLF